MNLQQFQKYLSPEMWTDNFVNVSLFLPSYPMTIIFKWSKEKLTTSPVIFNLNMLISETRDCDWWMNRESVKITVALVLALITIFHSTTAWSGENFKPYHFGLQQLFTVSIILFKSFQMLIRTRVKPINLGPRSKHECCHHFWQYFGSGRFDI